MVRFSLATGLRQANVTKLELNATAIEMSTKQIGKNPKWVFTYKGKPVIQVGLKLGTTHWNGQGSGISAGTIYGILGRVG
jgi:hypothetical protein